MLPVIYIDGVSLADLGVVLAPDSYKSVLQWASLKSVQSNDWAEHDYIEPDLITPCLDKRNVTLNFHANGLEGYERFLDHIREKAVFTWNFADLGVTLPLRVQSNSLKSVGKKWQSFSVAFVDDAPYTGRNAVSPFPQLGNNILMLDAYNLNYFGITVLDGTMLSLRQTGKVKERLTVSANNIDGAKYDTEGDVMTASNDITIKCLLRAPTMQTAVSNYFALLNYIRRAGLRRIVVNANFKTYDCYYKSQTCDNVTAKLASGMAGIAFSMTFSVVDKLMLNVLVDDAAEYALTDTQGVFLGR